MTAARALTPAQAATAALTLFPLATFADDGWNGLADAASEPNSFAESWFMQASVRALPVPPGARMAAVHAGGGDTRTLIGLMPLIVADHYGRMPVRHLENWLHYHCFMGAPLVRRGYEAMFWNALLAGLDQADDAPAFLHLVALNGDGPLAAALLAARAGCAIVHRSERALLASELGPRAYYEATVRKKKRKEIGRLQSRLRELGPVTSRRYGDGEDLDAWIDAFLALEASGWKGSDGAALANEAGTAAFLRAAVHGAAAAGRLDFVRLDLSDQPIAMLINFVAAPGSFSFKIAYDEHYARFSPGVLIQLDNLDVLDRSDIAWMDSCAAEDHPMINSLWGERRSIVRISVPLAGVARRAIFSTCRALEEAAASVRRVRGR